MEWRFKDQESSWGRDDAGKMGSDNPNSILCLISA